MLYHGNLLTPDLKTVLIDDIKTAPTVGNYLRQNAVIPINAPDPYFTICARDWNHAQHVLRYPPPGKWDALFLDNHLDVDRHDDHLGTQLCQWLRANPYFLPKEVFFISFDGRSEVEMYNILLPVYMESKKKNLHLYRPITDI